MAPLPIYSGKSSERKTDFPIITKHAWKRFITRHRNVPSCPMRKLRYLIANAVREDLGSGAVVRMLNNNFEEANYFHCDGWRIIYNEDMTTVVTIEKRIHRKPSKKKNPGKRSKSRRW